MVTTSEELCHSMKNFVKLVGDYLGKGKPLCQSMETWPLHVDHFERQYNNVFEKDHLFGEELVKRIHNQVQVLLHYCNTTYIGYIELGALSKFRSL